VTIESNHQARTFHWRGRQPGELHYLLYLPKGYDEHKQRLWPFVLFLHGAEERGNDLQAVTHHGIPRHIREGQDFPFIAVSPQCPAGVWWTERASILIGLVDDIAGSYAVDANRIYCTGMSMGGFGTWTLAIANPYTFAAIVPICGGGDPLQVCKIRHVPVWDFHGDQDSVVPIKFSESMVNALKACGGNVRYTVYPGVGHDSWTETYANPEVYSWMLAQSRA
jgi:predicted peptidase